MNDRPDAARESTLPDMPRVLMLLESYVPVVGGMEAQARNLAGALKAAGTSIAILTRCPDAALPRHDEIDGIAVTRIRPVGPNSRLRWFLVLTALPALYRMRHTYDIIFVPGFRAIGLTAVWAGKWLGKHAILKAESSGEFSGTFFAGGFEKSGIGAGLANWLIRTRNRQLRKADSFVGLSSEQAQEFKDGGVAPDRIRVIPQCLDENVFTPVSGTDKARLRHEIGLPENELIVVYTGRLVRYKGLPVLLEAWKTICAQQSSGRLVLVGAGGVDIYNCEEALHQYVQTNGLSDRVTFTGAVSNVPDYLKAADIYAFPTENEAFGLALIEAMGCGLAVLSTTTGGIKDFVEDERNALVMQAGNHDDAVQQLKRLLTEPDLRQRLGKAARETVVTRFTLDCVVQQYLSLFRKVTSRNANKGEHEYR